VESVWAVADDESENPKRNNHNSIVTPDLIGGPFPDLCVNRNGRKWIPAPNFLGAGMTNAIL